jgi:hypothetical protein
MEYYHVSVLRASLLQQVYPQHWEKLKPTLEKRAAEIQKVNGFAKMSSMAVSNTK